MFSHANFFNDLRLHPEQPCSLGGFKIISSVTIRVSPCKHASKSVSGVVQSSARNRSTADGDNTVQIV